MEHLRRPGLRRRQLERRLPGVQQTALGAYSAAGSVLLLYRNHTPGPPDALVRIREDHGAVSPELCHAADCRSWRHLPGLPTVVREESGMSSLIDRSEERRVGKECRSRWGT